MGWFRNLASVLTFGIVKDTYRKNLSDQEERERLEEEERERKKWEERAEMARQAEARRVSTPVVFEAPLTESRFSELAVLAGKQIKRLWIETRGAIVFGTVKTSSGIGEWNFKFDYNDYGRITGEHWELLCENFDSEIPEKFSNIFEELIHKELGGKSFERYDPKEEWNNKGLTLVISKVRLSWINDNSDNCIHEDTLNQSKIESVSWANVEKTLDGAFGEFDKIYYGSKMKMDNASYGSKIIIDDIEVKLRLDDSVFPYLVFAPYAGFLFKYNDNNGKVISSDDVRLLGVNYVKGVFREFYERRTIKPDSWWK